MRLTRFIITTLIILTALSTTAQRNYARLNRYQQANASLLNEHNPGNRVVFMGNSITDFWPRDHAEFFTDNGFVGRGIAGQTSVEMLSRFRQDVVNLQPYAVVICAGTNDIAQNLYDWYDQDFTLGNIISMAEIAQANGIKVYLASVPPATIFSWKTDITDLQQKIINLNNAIRNYAETHNCVYVDYHSALAAPDGTLPAEYSADGVHPNLAGYAVMESVILPLIK